MSYSIDIRVIDGHVVAEVPDNTDLTTLPALVRVTGHHVPSEDHGSESVGVAVFHHHPSEDDELVHVLNANAGTYNDRRPQGVDA